VAKDRRKKLSVTVSDPVLSSLEEAARDAGSGVSVPDVIVEVLERTFVHQATCPNELLPEGSMTSEEAFEMLTFSMRTLRGSAKHSSDSAGDFLKAASMGFEAMSMMERSGPESESNLLNLLLEVLDLVRKGTGYARLPDASFRMEISSDE